MAAIFGLSMWGVYLQKNKNQSLYDRRKRKGRVNHGGGGMHSGSPRQDDSSTLEDCAGTSSDRPTVRRGRSVDRNERGANGS